MSLQIIAGKFQGFSGKNMILLFLFNLRSKYAKWKKNEKIEEMLTELFFFKLLSFFDWLSYRFQIGLKWKIF